MGEYENRVDARNTRRNMILATAAVAAAIFAMIAAEYSYTTYRILVRVAVTALVAYFFSAANGSAIMATRTMETRREIRKCYAFDYGFAFLLSAAVTAALWGGGDLGIIPGIVPAIMAPISIILIALGW